MSIKTTLRLLRLLQQKRPSYNDLVELLFFETPPPDGNFISRAPRSCVTQTLKSPAYQEEMKAPAFSIVVPTYNGTKRSLDETMSALLSQEGIGKDRYEILLVDDGTKTDATENAVKEHIRKNPETKISYVKYPKNRGPAFARNIGIQLAKGEYICFTDDDCIVPKNWLLNFENDFIENPEITATGGWYMPVSTAPRKHVSLYDGFIFWIAIPGCLQKIKTKTKGGYTGNTANLCIRKSVLLAVGGFNHYFRFPSMEDWELRIRLLKKNYTLLYRPHMVLHKKNLNLTGFIRQSLLRGWASHLMCCLHPATEVWYRYTFHISIRNAFREIPQFLERRYLTVPIENAPPFLMMLIPLNFFRNFLLWFGKYWIALEIAHERYTTEEKR